MNILIFRTPYNSIYIRIFRPHMYYTHAPFARNSIYSVVTQRDHEYDLTTIAKEFYRAYFIHFVRSSLSKNYRTV